MHGALQFTVVAEKSQHPWEVGLISKDPGSEEESGLVEVMRGGNGKPRLELSILARSLTLFIGSWIPTEHQAPGGDARALIP